MLNHNLKVIRIYYAVEELIGVLSKFNFLIQIFSFNKFQMMNIKVQYLKFLKFYFMFIILQQILKFENQFSLFIQLLVNIFNHDFFLKFLLNISATVMQDKFAPYLEPVITQLSPNLSQKPNTDTLPVFCTSLRKKISIIYLYKKRSKSIRYTCFTLPSCWYGSL